MPPKSSNLPRPLIALPSPRLLASLSLSVNSPPHPRPSRDGCDGDTVPAAAWRAAATAADEALPLRGVAADVSRDLDRPWLSPKRGGGGGGTARNGMSTQATACISFT